MNRQLIARSADTIVGAEPKPNMNDGFTVRCCECDDAKGAKYALIGIAGMLAGALIFMPKDMRF